MMWVDSFHIQLIPLFGQTWFRWSNLQLIFLYTVPSKGQDSRLLLYSTADIAECWQDISCVRAVAYVQLKSRLRRIRWKRCENTVIEVI